jgi:hypoxanthine phosphoribosyltransferase
MYPAIVILPRCVVTRILKLPIAYIVIQSYSGKGTEDKQGQLMFAREISSLANNEDFNKVLLIDDLSIICFARL